MKAEDLMVGDRVLLFDDKPVKVDCIGNVEVYLSDENGIDWRVTYEHIKSIPLTPEILEKNGLDFCKIEAEFKQKDTMVIYGREAPFIILDSISVNYVHELQHALKLCGIGKEIMI